MMNDGAINVNRELIKTVLSQFQHVTLQKNLIAMNAVVECRQLGTELKIRLCMPFAWNSVFYQLKQTLTPTLLAMTHTNTITWSLEYNIATLCRANTQPPINNIKNIIAISSGKGGVGKSTTAVNVALALQKEGAQVGLLDADIYGPSVPTMLGTEGKKPVSPDNQHMRPIMACGMPTQSIGYLVDKGNAMVWRGPMASKALLQLVHDTLWPALDYLVIDMPPGTGDIQLTLAQNIPVTGVIIVTTPQDIALIDAAKGLNMFNKVHIPTIGIIENMSYHLCDHCGHREAIFGEGGAEHIALQHNSQLLGQIPLHASLCTDLDRGMPTVITQPEGTFSRLYCDIADRIAATLYWQGEVIADDIAVRMV